MADEADMAFELQERAVALSLAETRSRNTLAAKGTCHYCDEPVTDGRLFCDHFCQEDWEHEKRMRKLAGQLAATDERVVITVPGFVHEPALAVHALTS